MPAKLLVTHLEALKAKYGSGWLRIEQAVQQLVTADAARGITSSLVALDDHGLGGERALKGDPKSFKRAIDHVYQRHPRPDYIAIVGGPDVVPHQELKNPIVGDNLDPDATVPSDLPYACDAAWADSADAFLAPTRVVGRLPDLPFESDPGRLVRVLEVAATWQPPSQVAPDYFSISAVVWKICTEITLKKLFGNANAVRMSPTEGPGWSAADMKPQWHFINCHGSSAKSDFYGQEGENYPVSHQAPIVLQNAAPGTVVAAECCYGAELYDPRLATHPGICVSYLAAGAIGFMGSTNVAYGGSNNVSACDYILSYFLEHVRKGASLGRAVLEARLEYVRTSESPLSPADLKTVAQFLLLGDPSLRAVAPTPFETFTSGKPAIKAHDARRRTLAGEADTIARQTARADVRFTSISPEAVRVRLEREAAASGYVAFGSSRAYGVRVGRDLPGAGPRQDAENTTFHLMGARPEDAGGPMSAVGAAEVSNRLLIVAREVNGQITSIEKLWARTGQATGETVFEGRVIKQRIALGSKSEHDAVLLETPDGPLELRRRDGNPFVDPVLAELVGHRIRGTGNQVGRLLILREWIILEDA